MEAKLGRLIDHLHLCAADLAASRRFYAALLAPLGVPVAGNHEHFPADEFWVDRGETPSCCHLAFQAPDRATVDRAYAAGLRDNGPPGERAYHPGYYAAFLFDPDGNNIEVVRYGPAERSADAITVRWRLPD